MFAPKCLGYNGYSSQPGRAQKFSTPIYHNEAVVQLRNRRRADMLFGEITRPQHESAALIGHACGLCLISHLQDRATDVVLQVLLIKCDKMCQLLRPACFTEAFCIDSCRCSIVHCSSSICHLGSTLALLVEHSLAGLRHASV